ncbi:MAG: hypothetical protein JWL62_1381 [Hyphomicrobiales bacterium]|jgi:hypothetical protein|nr:hypothetical protein [Hyphomicrobiales bacterium]
MIPQNFFSRLVLAAAAFACIALPASAAPAKAKPAPKGVVTVSNARESTLLELAIVSKNKKLEPEIVARNLESGASIKAKLPKTGGCLYDIDGLFEDQTTIQMPGLNLCKDATLRFTDQ